MHSLEEAALNVKDPLRALPEYDRIQPPKPVLPQGAVELLKFYFII